MLIKFPLQQLTMTGLLISINENSITYHQNEDYSLDPYDYIGIFLQHLATSNITHKQLLLHLIHFSTAHNQIFGQLLCAKGNPRLDSLLIHIDSKLEDSIIQTIIQSINASTSPKELCLQCTLSSESIIDLFGAVARSSQVKILELSLNSYNTLKIGITLMAMLHQNQHIQELHLTGINAKTLDYLNDGLSHNSTLQKLSLILDSSRFESHCENAKGLEGILRHNKSLRSFTFGSASHIHTVWFEHLLAGLSVNETLLHLHIRNAFRVPLDQKNKWIALFALLKTKSIETFSIHCSHLGYSAVKALKDLICQTKTLTTVEIKECGLSEEDRDSLCISSKVHVIC